MNETTKFKFAIIGLGRISKYFMYAVSLMDNVEIVACGSSDKERAEKYALENNISSYGTYEEIASLDTYDAVYICNNIGDHYKTCQLFLNAKKNVLIEKSITTSTSKVKALFKLAKENNVVLLEAMKIIYLPTIIDVVSKVTNGTYGQLKEINGSFQTNHKNDLNTRYFNKKLGGGSLYDLGCYLIVYSLELLEKVDSIKVLNSKMVKGVDGEVSFELRNSTATAKLTSGILESPTGTHYQVFEIITDKYKIIHNGFGVSSFYEIINLETDEKEEVKFPLQHDFIYEINYFIDRVNNQDKIENKHSKALSIKTLQIIDTILKTIKEQKENQEISL